MGFSLRDSRYRMPAEKRRFGKQVFTYLEQYRDKRQAEWAAERWRQKGYLVRLVKLGRGYALYTKP